MPLPTKRFIPTPMQTFVDRVPLALAKQLAA